VGGATPPPGANGSGFGVTRTFTGVANVPVGQLTATDTGGAAPVPPETGATAATTTPTDPA
jgi:hypothetical protein